MKTLITAILGLLVVAQAALAENPFCDTDQNFSDMAQCVVNDPIDTCRMNFPTCNVDDYIIDAGDPISTMINQCCKPGDADAEWDACFLARVAQIRKAKALPLAFRRYIKTRVTAYINDPELECTEH